MDKQLTIERSKKQKSYNIEMKDLVSLAKTSKGRSNKFKRYLVRL